jgi:hypothetical protein
MLPHHKGVEWDTIGVGRGASAKLWHFTGSMLTYPMENEIPFV